MFERKSMERLKTQVKINSPFKDEDGVFNKEFK
jgi:hypothetical protein